MDKWLVVVETLLEGLKFIVFFASSISVSFFISFLLLHADQMNVCTAVEKIMKAKFPRPCLDLNASPGTHRAHMLMATFPPSKSHGERNQLLMTLQLYGASPVI